MAVDKPQRQRVADFVVSALQRRGVKNVFGVGGANIEDLYDALQNSGISGVVAKHECSAAMMADGYARVTGRLGVVMATSGGGAMNLVAGLAESHASRIPVLALVGQPPTTLDGSGAFQEGSGQAGSLDTYPLFAAVARHCRRVTDPADMAEALGEAIAAAESEPQGPAVLLLPKDIQQSLIPVATAPSRPRSVAGSPADLVTAACGTLTDARSILVIAGEGAARAKTELLDLVRRMPARVAVTPDAKDAFDNRHPAYLGVTGVMGHAEVIEYAKQATACLLVGTRLPMVARDGLDPVVHAVPVISVGPEPPFVPALNLDGDLRMTLDELTARLPERDPDPMRTDLLRLPMVASGNRYEELIAAVQTALPERAHVFVDAGNIGAAAIHWLTAPRDGRCVVALGMGGMGYTFGAGIGAAIGDSRRTYVLAGDGSFFMHGMEIHTAIEYDADVTFIVVNNNAHAMCVTREQLFYAADYSFNRFRPADIGSGVAAMFPSLPVVRAESAAEVGAAVRAGAALSGPSLITVDVPTDEMPPFRPFIAAQHDRRTA
ncbi:thiamine pyrophosphate-binding protein [Pseudonocardiaceae bacterium YIM PH 21723]|nr:thiamine pyrophosphate-binding protein [Pseudonocardiaceae bacterium YIM PH 21723]